MFTERTLDGSAERAPGYTNKRGLLEIILVLISNKRVVGRIRGTKQNKHRQDCSGAGALRVGSDHHRKSREE